MPLYIKISTLVIFITCALTGAEMAKEKLPQQSTEQPVAIAIHGGAGTILKSKMTPEKEQAYRKALQFALETGYAILQKGGSSLDAVEATIRTMEDSPLFNAGKGAVFTNAGTNEMDASIMDGKTRQAGAVARVTHVKNPISLARKVMINSPHVFLVGEGAEDFARENEIELVVPEYFRTDERWQQLQKIKQKEDSGQSREIHLDHDSDHKFGTVGVVALDRDGNLAAGTSTGGMTNKRYGRIGDSPVIGAGTYADNATCAVSATGHGEYFIRGVVAYDIAAMMQYKNISVNEAADAVIMEKLTKTGGTGGVISLDRKGNIAMPFNTAGMYRGYVDRTGNYTIKIYKE